MADDTVLDKPHAVALLQKLSTDDKFRADYMANPRGALLAVGVPANTVSSFPDKAMAPMKTLADKSVFAAALAQVQADLADVCACQKPPQIRFNFGS